MTTSPSKIEPLAGALEISEETVSMFPFDPVAADPDAVIQLISQLPEGATIAGLLLDEEQFKVVKVMIGPQQLSLAECRGKTTPKQPGYVITLAQNITKEPQVARGGWCLTGVAPPAKVDSLAIPREDPGAPGKPSNGGNAGVAPLAASPMPSIHTSTPGFAQGAPPSTSRSVTPGNNEVAVLLHRSEVERLIAWLTGKDPVSEHEKPGIIRQLGNALTR